MRDHDFEKFKKRLIIVPRSIFKFRNRTDSRAWSFVERALADFRLERHEDDQEFSFSHRKFRGADL